MNQYILKCFLAPTWMGNIINNIPFDINKYRIQDNPHKNMKYLNFIIFIKSQKIKYLSIDMQNSYDHIKLYYFLDKKYT